MRLPPSVKSILPSLRVNDEDKSASLAMADVKKHLPSLRIRSENQDLPDATTITVSIEDLRKMLRVALAGVEVDEKWYAAQVPGLEDALKDGDFKSATEHYFIHGYLEGRPPQRPTVDEDYYLKAHPDIAQAVKAGQLRSGYEHYVTTGYAEGRIATAPPAAPKRKK